MRKIIILVISITTVLMARIEIFTDFLQTQSQTVTIIPPKNDNDNSDNHNGNNDNSDNDKDNSTSKKVISKTYYNFSIEQNVIFYEEDAENKKMIFKVSVDKPLPKDLRLKYKLVQISKKFKVRKDVKQNKTNYITFKKGEKNFFIKLDVIDDNIYEGNESFKLKLKVPRKFKKYSDGSTRYTSYKYISSIGTIVDNEISLTINDYIIFSEDEANNQKMRFDIAIGEPLDKDLKIYYKIKPKGNLHFGEDIVKPLKNYVTIKKGEKNVYLDIQVLNDNIEEDAEYFKIELKKPKEDNIGFINSKAIGVILDDDKKYDIPKQEGDYYIYEHNTLNSKIKTKIVNQSSKLDVIASEGFEIFQGKKKKRERSCSAPSCEIKEIDGQQVKVCTRTCTIKITTILSYSDSMDIDKIILHAFKNYNPSTNSCSAENKQILKRNIHLKSGGKYTFSLPTNNAYRCNWIEVLGHSDKDANNSVKKFKGISDSFAIRPDRFELDLSGYNDLNPLIAQQSIKITLKAVDKYGNIVTSYNQNNYHESLKDSIYGDSLSNGLNINNLRFRAGKIEKMSQYDNVGDLTIKVEEVAPYFAQIDKNDNPNGYKITPVEYKLKVIPDKFDITYSMKNANPTDKFTLFANDLSQMYSILDYSIQAKGALGKVLTRYDKNGYAKNVDINITQSILTNTQRNLTLNYQASKTDYSTSFDTSKKKILKLTLDKYNFINGISQQKIIENFTRNHKKAENPLFLKTDSIVAQESFGNVKGDKSILSFVTYYYAREHVPSPQTIAGNILNSVVYYEIYCKNCDKSTFIKAKNLASIDEIYWYRLKKSEVNNFVIGNFDFSNVYAKGSGTIAKKVDNFTIQTKTIRVPNKGRVYYTPSPFLQYNRFANTTPVQHHFDISFSAKGGVWAGEGKLGTTVDTDIASQPNKALEW